MLRKDYGNLFLVDIICHGTPSPKLWREYVKYYECKYGKLEYESDVRLIVGKMLA